jgi:multiple sugar transport system ATP-binding protein
VAEIILDQITKRFPDGALAVDKVSLDIADGEFIILVGPSGCGKSTTLNMIAGLEDITSGELRIGGKVVNDKAPKDRDIAMVFQSYALYPHMTVRENMGFALKLAKTPKNVIDEKVNEAARVLDLNPFLDRRPANLSGGQRQRVAMGRAIVRDPAAFLMDEPLSNLDAKLRVQTRTEVSRLQKRLGTTMVYVTHDQTEAMTLGDRVAVMRLGVLQQVASPQELYDQPVNLFVAGFMGSPSMNFMAGNLEDGKLHTVLGDFPLTGQLRQELERAGAGRDVIVGIRPENFEDAEIVPSEIKANGLEFNASIDVSESLGSEKFVYFTRELGHASNVAELEELARDSGRADAGGAASETVVARLDPASRIHEGQDARLWVDVRKLHVFDPSTGRNLSLGAAGAPGAAAPAAAGGAGATGEARAADRAEQATTAEPATAAEQASTTDGQAPTTADPASGTDSR